jgi:hypothetical protein
MTGTIRRFLILEADVVYHVAMVAVLAWGLTAAARATAGSRRS